MDRPAQGPLPVHPYRYVAIKTVNIDYHVSDEPHLDSVPHQDVALQAGDPHFMHLLAYRSARLT